MSILRCRPALAALLLGTVLLPLTVQAETRSSKPDKAAQASQPVTLLGGKLAFTLPAGFVKEAMPELDAKTAAKGVSGAMYSDAAHKRVLIVTETPIPVEGEADDDDARVLDELTAATMSQQGSSYQDFQRLGEQRVLKDNGLGVRQLDASATLSGAPVLSTTLIAASGKRSAVLNVISSSKDPEGHQAVVKGIIGH